MQKVLEDWHGTYHTHREGRLKNCATMEIHNQPHTRRRSHVPVPSKRSGTGEGAEQPDDRPERSTPHHLPHGYHTEAELDAFTQGNQPEDGP